jgi:mannose-6-phosphate isomerase
MPTRITGAVQHYAWGDTAFLPALLGRPADGTPWAEWWLGTHHVAPSLTESGSPLEDVTGPMAMLVKVLSCAAPLSLQTHPTADQARRGFARENSAGTALDDPRRNYRDESPKPEMLVALTEFEALCGFDDVDSTVEQLKAYRWHEEAEMLDLYGIDGYMLWAFDQRTSPDLGACPEWLGRIGDMYPGDRGLRVAPLLNHVHLAPGEAISLPAGNLHAYLRGAGLEVMASSDNVIRAGFTAKHVDVTEVQHVVDTSVLENPKLRPLDGVYPGPNGAFTVERIDVAGSVTVDAASLTVLVRTSGAVDGLAPDQAMVLVPGESADLTGTATVWACRQG